MSKIIVIFENEHDKNWSRMSKIGQECQKLDNFKCENVKNLIFLNVENDKKALMAFLEAKKFN